MDTLPAALAEGTEAEVMYQLVSMAPPSIKSRLQIATTRIGGGVALSVGNDPTGFWSKALGFGFAEPVTRDLIGRVVDFYRAQDSKGAVVQIAPSALPPNWNEICAEYGLRPDSYWVKLAAPVEDFRAGQSTLRVSPVAPESALEWATVTFRGFGMPEDGFAEMMAGSVANPDVRPFAAWDGDAMVATGTLLVRGEIGSLNAGATLPGHRNQGAQSALLATRAEEAAKAGCRWLIAETGLPAQGESNPSLNNLLRSGFRPLYSRRNWIWRPDAA
ncbi:GNAT family N-acetyltransferase [Nonomuraea sp. NBC_00507]|uniref:GNAT family N-acetyltransferase n=1 Tax=Nonomuraea sp. NBC_00507 TaxID=2976002 RepID=UPI002E19B1DE